jgi:hypothetical protein
LLTSNYPGSRPAVEGTRHVDENITSLYGWAAVAGLAVI